MQRLLTEDEYQELVHRGDMASEDMQEILQDLCTRVCNHMPVNWGWGEPKDPKPWGCILTEKGEWYCDSCPVQKVCPNEHKEWSK